MLDDTPALPVIRVEALSATRAQRQGAGGLARQPGVGPQPAQLRDDRAALPRRAPNGRTATAEDVRDAIVAATVGASTSTARQYTLRIKSMLSYGHELGYMPFNAGVRIKVQNDAGGLLYPPGPRTT